MKSRNAFLDFCLAHLWRWKNSIGSFDLHLIWPGHMYALLQIDNEGPLVIRLGPAIHSMHVHAVIMTPLAFRLACRAYILSFNL